MNQYALATLYDCKDMLGIGQDDTTNDDFLEALIESCSVLAEDGYLHRKMRARDFTEYHDGGRAHLFVHNPPINSIASIYDDVLRDWGSGTLVDSDDYHYDGDFADQGRVQLYGSSGFYAGLRNLKITYNGGFDRFVVTSGENDYIDWYDTDSGTEYTTALTAATYTGADLATHISTQMTAEDSDDTITCTYNTVTGKFTIASDGDYFMLAWANGTDTAKTAGKLLGFDVSADDSGATSYTAGYARLGIPRPIQAGITLWVARLFKDSFKGDGRMGVTAKNVSVAGSGTTYELLNKMPEQTKLLLAPYRIMNQ